MIPFPFQAGGFGLAGSGGGAPPTPTYATWSAGDKAANLTLTGGDLIVTHNGFPNLTNGLVRATSGKSSGKWYFEIIVNNPTASPFALVGIAPLSLATSGYPGGSSDSYGYYQQAGEKYNNSTAGTFGAAWSTTNDIIGVAVDLDNGKIWWAKNGAWQGGGDPDAGTGEAYSSISGTYYPALSLHRSSAQVVGRFSPASQTYSAPTGFTAGWTV